VGKGGQDPGSILNFMKGGHRRIGEKELEGGGKPKGERNLKDVLCTWVTTFIRNKGTTFVATRKGTFVNQCRFGRLRKRGEGTKFETILRQRWERKTSCAVPRGDIEDF